MVERADGRRGTERKATDERPEDRRRRVARRIEGATSHLAVRVVVVIVVFVLALLPDTGPLVAAFAAVLVGVLLHVNWRRAYHEDRADRDGLTGLYNNGANEADLTQLTDRGRPFAVFFMDVDRFKLINDNNSHEAGNRVLEAFAESLVALTPPTDCAYRVGGDEFVIVATRAMSEDECRAYAGQIERAVEREVTYDGTSIVPRTSVGFARFPEDGNTGREVRDVADGRMYEIKERRHAEDGLSVDDARLRVGSFNFYAATMRAPIPFYAYQLNERMDLLFVNEAGLALCGTSSLSETFERMGPSFSDLVHPDDLDQLRRSLAARSTDARRGFVHGSCRLRDTSGGEHPVETDSLIVETSRHGLVAYTFASEA